MLNTTYNDFFNIIAKRNSESTSKIELKNFSIGGKIKSESLYIRKPIFFYDIEFNTENVSNNESLSRIDLPDCHLDLISRHQIVFINCKFNGPISISGIIKSYITFKSCYFNGSISINGIINSLSFEKNHGDKILLDYLSCAMLSIDDAKENTFEFKTPLTSINELNLRGDFFNTNITIYEAQFKKVNFYSVHLDKFTKILLDNLYLNQIYIYGLKNEGEISIIRPKFYGNTYRFSSDSYKGQLFTRMRKIQLSKRYFSLETKMLSFHFPNISIKKSILGSLAIVGLMDSGLKESEIIDTKFEMTKLTETYFSLGTLKSHSLFSLYELYVELTNMAKHDGNNELKIKYTRNALHTLKEYLFKDGIIKNFSSLSSLFISQFFSNYGTNAVKSSFLTLSIPSILFITMLLQTGYDIDFSAEGIDKFLYLSSYYIQFLNPIHKITFMDNLYTNYTFSDKFIFVFLDYLSRILVGIGIYETIKSFRKYGRN